VSMNSELLQSNHGSGPCPAGEYDVIVVGARVAGAATAMLLARRGKRVLLLDRAPRPGTDTLSTHALMRGGVVQLQRWGLLPALVAAGTPALRHTLVHYGEEVEDIEIKERAGVSFLCGPRRTVLDPLLVEAAREAGADVFFGVAVEDLLITGGRVRGVVGRDREGHGFCARAAMTVGADGMQSLVAQRVRAPLTWSGTAASAFLYGYWSDVPTDAYEWFYRPRATAGIIPTNNGRTCIWVGAPAATLPALQADGLHVAFDRLIAEAAPEAQPRLAVARRVERLRGFAGLAGYLRRPYGRGWALVGDAGAFRDPISAHGITDALRDAELLARAAVEVVTGGIPERDALAGYQARRDELSGELFDLVDVIAGHGWTDADIGGLLLGLNVAMTAELEAVAALGDLPAPARAAA